MMNNLFSIFDPSTSLFSFSWVVIFLPVLMVSFKIMKLSNPSFKLFYYLVTTFKKEVSFNLKKSEKGTEILIMVAFLLVAILNFVALYPQVFSVTSHLTITFPISLFFWLSVSMFGWVKNTSHMLSHLVPQGTPLGLMSFMVLIELISSIIRPVTLCVRLTANLIAGHLLMSLLGGALAGLSALSILSVAWVPLILTILEIAVALIQAYVFMTLITLYTMEIK